jgi:MoxR-like ATPase
LGWTDPAPAPAPAPAPDAFQKLDDKKTIDHIRSEAARLRHKLLTNEQPVMLLKADTAQEALVAAMDKIADAVQSASNDPVAFSTELAADCEADRRRAHLQRLFGQLEEGLLERGVEVRLLVLAALLGEHLLFVGPPGTAKSELCRRLSKLCEGRYFERLLTRFTLPEELFGPLSLQQLEQDIYQRRTEGYLPTAHFVFLDEVFKVQH